MTSPPRVSPGDERVRRPTDLLFGVLSLAVVLVVVGSIRALPLGSTELSNDVSRALEHIPRWLSSLAAVAVGIGCFLFAGLVLFVLVRRVWRDALNAGAAGLTAAAAAIAVWIVWRVQNGSVAHAVIHGKNPLYFVIDSAFVAFLVGSDLARRSRWFRRCMGAAAALLLTGLAIDALTPLRRRDRAVRRADDRLAGALAAARGVGPPRHRRADGLAERPWCGHEQPHPA